MVTALKLLATAGLGAGYLAVASMAAHPRVDAEYDAHFLHRSAECWLPPAASAAGAVAPASRVIEIGRIGYPEACRYLRMGWYAPLAWGAWSFGTNASLHLPRQPGARAVELTLRTAPPPNPAIHARFVLNGRTEDEEIAPGTTATVTFPLPPENESYDPDMHLSFGTYAVVPTPASRRNAPMDSRVGVGLVAIRYVPAQSAASDARP